MKFFKICTIFFILALFVGYFGQSVMEKYFINLDYNQALISYSNNNGQKNIVLLGDSLTYRANWSVLLNRNDIANMGIDNDTSSGYLHRLKYVTDVHPVICFIEGGINDLQLGYSIEEIVDNLHKIVYILKRNNITPVALETLLLTEKHPRSKIINPLVKKLNVQIEMLAKSEDIKFLQLNSILSEDGYLSEKYSLSDGIHLNSIGYSYWAREINAILKNKMYSGFTN